MPEAGSALHHGDDPHPRRPRIRVSDTHPEPARRHLEPGSAAVSGAAPVAGVGLRSERGPILLALMLSTGLIAIDSTILATAVPTITRELGGFAQFPWLFSIYLLAQAVAVPVYSKLADTLGRKPVMLAGIALFLLGSILCGVAWDMPSLIAFRAVQGLGAGAIQPLAMTIAGDIYTLAERAKTQGYMASVWAISSVVGPTLGGVFAQLDAWRWIFFINVPLCLIAAALLLRNFHESVEKRKHRIDYLGAALLTGALALLILGVLEGGQAWAWASTPSFVVFGVGALLLVAALIVESRAAEPILPLRMLRSRLLVTTNLISLAIGAVVLGLTSYVPTYLEGSIGTAPLLAGLALAALTLGWPIAATLSGRLYLRFGFKRTVLTGMVFLMIGTLALVATAGTPSVVTVAITAFVTGLGCGLIATPSLLAAQSTASWGERGVVTGLNMFARSVGSAVGVAVFGAIANALIRTGAGGEQVASSVVAGSSAVFVAVVVVALLALAAAVAMPRTPVAQREAPAAGAPGAGAGEAEQPA
ncbi:MFS transporter [Schumannella luteola]|nr:MFS transporter [Schumannella luteola]